MFEKNDMATLAAVNIIFNKAPHFSCSENNATFVCFDFTWKTETSGNSGTNGSDVDLNECGQTDDIPCSVNLFKPQRPPTQEELEDLAKKYVCVRNTGQSCMKAIVQSIRLATIYSDAKLKKQRSVT
jgi:hypothetical protein